MPLASADERKSTSDAISSGLTHLDGSAFGMSRRFSGVSMIDGRIAFAVMPSAFTAAARDSVQRSRAVFAIAYPALSFVPRWALNEPMLTMRP